MKKVKKKIKSPDIVWKKNVGYSRHGIAVLRRSPKFPDEGEWQQHVRLWCRIADDAPVVVDQSVEAAPVKDEVVPEEVYPGTPKQRRSPGKLPKYYTVGGGPPFVLRGTKWKEIRLWAERTMEHFADDGKFVTIHCLCSLARELGLPDDQTNKVVRRLKTIYQEEYAHERAEGEILLSRSLRTESPETAASTRAPRQSADSSSRAPKAFGAKQSGTDKWGFRLNTRTSRINDAITAELKTAKEIEKEVGCESSSSHLGKLVRMGVVVKVGKGYKLAKEEQCQTPSRSESSERSKSTPRSAGSRKEKAAKRSKRPSSTGRSAKGKSGKSGKRASRKA